MKQQLSEIVAKSAALTQLIIEAGGELSPELEAALAQVDLALAEKVDGYQYVMERLQKEADYFAGRADEYSRVARGHKALGERIKQRVKDAMVAMDKTEVLGVDTRFKLTKVAPRLLVNEAALDPAYKMTVTETVPDKERIKKDLIDGKPVAGAHLEQGFGLRSYPNKESK